MMVAGGENMQLDYHEIGQRIARRRRALNLRQAEVEEMADLGYKYLSNIERGISIPSTEVIMRLAVALDTTPDAFLVGAVQPDDGEHCVRSLSSCARLHPGSWSWRAHSLPWPLNRRWIEFCRHCVYNKWPEIKEGCA